MKSSNRVPIIIATCAVIILGVFGILNLTKKSTDNPSPPVSNTVQFTEKPDQSAELFHHPIYVTEYSAIKTGMSYNRVVKIIGIEGREITSAALNGFTSATYLWSNENGSSLGIVFQNGRVISKSQNWLE